jgi:hypothetical protein
MSGRRRNCYWCQRPMESAKGLSALAATRDHVHPKSRGGKAIVWSCRACNSLKGDMTGDEWHLFRTMNEKWWKLYKDRACYRAALRALPGYYARARYLTDYETDTQDVPLIQEHQRRLEELRARFAKTTNKEKLNDPSPERDRC